MVTRVCNQARLSRMSDLIGHDFVPIDYLSSPCRICRSGVERHQDWPDYRPVDNGTGQWAKDSKEHPDA